MVQQKIIFMKKIMIAEKFVIAKVHIGIVK